MATGFQRVKYEADSGSVYLIRASTQTIGLTQNPAATGTVTDSNVKVSVSGHGNKRLNGIKARGVVLAEYEGTGRARKRFGTFVPIFTKAGYAAINVGDTITLGATAYTVESKVSEA